MMGLLAGSKLASQTLKLTAGSQLLLSDIFPSVPHIRRFNLTTEKAQGVLDNAEDLLGILAVPQVMALQEDVMTGMLDLLEQNIAGLGNISTGARTVNIHEKFQDATRTSFTPESLELFHLVRKARNTHIHNGGRASQTLVDAISATNIVTLRTWENITKTPFPVYQVGDPVHLGLSELIGILALTKRLAEEANEILQRVLPASVWADLAVEHWLKTRKPGNSEQQFKQLLGLAKMNYMAVSLSEADLRAAQSRVGVA